MPRQPRARACSSDPAVTDPPASTHICRRSFEKTLHRERAKVQPTRHSPIVTRVGRRAAYDSHDCHTCGGSACASRRRSHSTRAALVHRRWWRAHGKGGGPPISDYTVSGRGVAREDSSHGCGEIHDR
jgi:hypothetical protein